MSESQLDPVNELLDNIDKAPIKVDMRHVPPINDPKCNHKFYLDIKDPDAKLFDVYKCHNCPIGHLVDKS